MNKLLVIAALAALSACSKPAPAPEAEASAVPEAAATNIAADGKPSVGTFKVTTADGKVVMADVKADGTYSSSIDGKVVETGKWEQKSPELYCYTKDEKDAVQQCDEEKVENGVYTSKNPKGEVSTVERVES